jgi:cytochrome c peroxidase
MIVDPEGTGLCERRVATLAADTPPVDDRFLAPRRRAFRRAAMLTWLCVLGLFAAAARAAGDPPEPISPLPLTVEQDPARVALGAQLFGDSRVSRGDAVSCASCHPLDRGGMDSQARAIGLGGKRLRNTPTVFNGRFNLYLNWDGAHESLTKHTEAVLLNSSLMNQTWPDLLAKLRAMPIYMLDFLAIYPDGVTRANVLDAIASFERSLVTPNARFDRYLRGQRDALSADELRGYQLFKFNGCVACHQGINIGGNMVQRFGVFATPDDLHAADEGHDDGRIHVTKDPLDQDVFRVPSLRNVAVTGPYFHDGRAATLEEAVSLMGRAQLGRNLSGQDIQLIVAFLKTLTGEYNGRSLAAAPPGSKP